MQIVLASNSVRFNNFREIGARDLADEEDHRRGVLEGDMHAGGGVGGAGASRRSRCLAGRLTYPGFGHHRRAAFLPADHHLDTGLVQSVERREVTLARHAEDARHAPRLQVIGQDISAVARRHDCSSNYGRAQRRAARRRFWDVVLK